MDSRRNETTNDDYYHRSKMFEETSDFVAKIVNELMSHNKTGTYLWFICGSFIKYALFQAHSYDIIEVCILSREEKQRPLRNIRVDLRGLQFDISILSRFPREASAISGVCSYLLSHKNPDYRKNAYIGNMSKFFTMYGDHEFVCYQRKHPNEIVRGSWSQVLIYDIDAMYGNNIRHRVAARHFYKRKIKRISKTISEN